MYKYNCQTNLQKSFQQTQYNKIQVITANWEYNFITFIFDQARHI